MFAMLFHNKYGNSEHARLWYEPIISIGTYMVIHMRLWLFVLVARVNANDLMVQIHLRLQGPLQIPNKSKVCHNLTLYSSSLQGLQCQQHLSSVSGTLISPGMHFLRWQSKWPRKFLYLARKLSSLEQNKCKILSSIRNKSLQNFNFGLPSPLYLPCNKFQHCANQKSPMSLFQNSKLNI